MNYDERHDFIAEARIEETLAACAAPPDPARVREILAKSKAIETLDPAECATLLAVEDAGLLEEMRRAAGEVKRKVYDNRIVTFAPLYVANRCVNRCLYCGYRADNRAVNRAALSAGQIADEVAVLAGKIGHKRLIAVFGEHPSTGADYIVEALRTIYATKVPKGRGQASIRRVNVNAAPMSVDDLKKVKEAGLGTYQVFQETYHRATYERFHPAGTPKGDYLHRLHAMHRAFEAGIDDVGCGALFGLADWKHDVMGLLAHARELERVFAAGPHTVSFPRMEPAAGSDIASAPPRPVSDRDFERLVVVLRLAIPYSGMILTARENAAMRRRVLPLGCTQTDASTRTGVGEYAGGDGGRQFEIADPRSLDEVVRDLAGMGLITSFCTAGYRCSRTGKCILDLLKSGQEGKFCKLNAVLTYREWLDDFASEATRAAGMPLLEAEIAQIRERLPMWVPAFEEQYARIVAGERDLFF